MNICSETQCLQYLSICCRTCHWNPSIREPFCSYHIADLWRRIFVQRFSFLHGAALAALIVGAPVAASPFTPAAAQSQTTTTTTVTVEEFREKLTPVGEYVRVEGLGEVWKPRNVADDWQPYSTGRWIFNEKVGWYFESDEPWAEITYHYGRWYDDPNEGWVWVADTQWAPAWVEWRRSKNYVGWRPLPPENAPRASTRTATRKATTVSRKGRSGGREVEAEEWVFVPTERITVENVRTVRVERTRVVEIYEETRPIGRVERRGAFAVNFAIQPQVIERETHVTIQSRNLPAPEAVPVPAPVREVATERRTTTTTTEQQRSTTGTVSGTTQQQRQGSPSAASGTTTEQQKPGTAPTTTGTNTTPPPASGKSGTETATGAKTGQPSTAGSTKGATPESGQTTTESKTTGPAGQPSTTGSN